MGRLLGATACALLLTSCAESGHTADEPRTPAEVVGLVSQTAGGGHTAPRATSLPDDAAVDRYVAGFDASLADRVRAAVEHDRPAGGTLYAQVVAVGCDVPPGARVDVRQDVRITADPVRHPKPECFAPVTTVALALVPANQ